MCSSVPVELLSVFPESSCSIIHMLSFYCAMHFSAKRGIEIAYRLSVCLSVTIRYRDHIP